MAAHVLKCYRKKIVITICATDHVMVEGESDGGVDDDDGDHSEKAKQEEIRRDMELMVGMMTMMATTQKRQSRRKLDVIWS